MSIRENLARVRADISNRAQGGEVKILAAVKAQPVEKVRELVAAGVRVLGCNYAQEGERLMRELGDVEVEWHFIGHIQSRKVKYLPAYDCIQSLDRLEVAKALQKALGQEQLSVLVEVNIGEERQKSGVAPAELSSFLTALKHLPGLKIEGLMAMPPAGAGPESSRPYFRRMHVLYTEMQKNYPLRYLSMGTSEDFLVAVEEGSNLVRLGTVLLGPRLKRSDTA